MDVLDIALRIARYGKHHHPPSMTIWVEWGRARHMTHAATECLHTLCGRILPGHIVSSGSHPMMGGAMLPPCKACMERSETLSKRPIGLVVPNMCAEVRLRGEDQW